MMAGLFFAPLAALPASASMQMEPGMSMGKDMPCCPKPQLPDCSKSCPIMTFCAATGLPDGPSATAGPVLRPWVSAALGVFNDAERQGLLARPPPRPPRA